MSFDVTLCNPTVVVFGDELNVDLELVGPVPTVDVRFSSFSREIRRRIVDKVDDFLERLLTVFVFGSSD